MARIYNSDLFKELKDGAKIQQAIDKVPEFLADKVVPVIEVNPKLLRIINIVERNQSTSTGNMTIYTTPTKKDFYLCGIFYSYHCNAIADSVNYAVRATIKGGTVNQRIIELTKETLTESKDKIYMEFSKPILIERNSTIIGVQGFTAGASTHTGIIYGYVVDSSTN